ncbi:MAG: DUF1318 domain-containing protein [Acidobacteriota bacterium]|nr:DUF1318 domain-containing protein [Acidobacteriota bacterium]
MKRSTPLLLITAALATVVLAACVTINVYFPEEKVRELSEQIEDAVEEQAAQDDGTVAEPSDLEPSEAEAANPESSGAETSGAETSGAGARISPAGWLLHLLPASQALAADEVAAPEISNPAIRRIIQSRAQRLPEIRNYLQSGVLGENNQALLEIRSLEDLDLRQRAEVQRLVKAENGDRDRMFEEIAAATGAEMSQLPQIRRTYAETLRQKADRGTWIQEPDGSWRRK